MAPVTRLSDASHPPANMTPSPSVSQSPAALGPEPGNAASESPDGAPSARPAGENAGAHDGSGPSADRERAEDHPRRWAGADQALDTARNARTARLESDSRADWIAPGDRQVMSPVNKPSPTIFVEKGPTPTAEAFRSQNLGPIVERIAVSVRGNQSEARVALKPDHLGSIRLQIATDNSTVNIKIMTEFPMARDLLESHLPQLKTDLQQQGLELEEFNVTLDNEEQYSRGGNRRQPGALRSLPASGRRAVPSDQSGQDLSEKPPAVGRSSATVVDFFA